MKFRDLLAESKANFSSGASKALLGALFLFPVVLGLMLVETLEASSLEQGSREYLASGAATYVIESEQGINGAACDALAQTDGFMSSGAIRTIDVPLIPSKLPASPLKVFQASAGFGRVLTGAPNGTYSMLASAEVAAKLGEHGPRFGIDTHSEQLQISATFQPPEGPLAAGLGWAVIQSVDGSKPFDQCWATAWPPSTAHQQLMRQSESISAPKTTDGSSGSSPKVTQLNTALGTSYAYGSSFDNRLSRYFPLAALLAGAGTAFLLVKLRSLELAALLHDGWQHRQVSRLVLLDNMKWAVLSVTCALAISMTVSWFLSPHPDVLYNFLTLVAYSVAGGLGVALGSWVGMRTVKEERLFQLFKHR